MFAFLNSIFGVNMRLSIVVLSLIFLTGSCEVIYDIAVREIQGDESIYQLKLDYTQEPTWFDEDTKVEGTVTNQGDKVIEDIRIKVTITHIDGTVTTEGIPIPRIDPGASYSFKERILTVGSDEVSLKLHSSHY